MSGLNIVICGSRGFFDQTYFDEQVHDILKDFNYDEITICSGGAPGTDTLAENFARRNQIDLLIKFAKWNKFRKSAGMIRNNQLLKMADKVISFWDGESPGTAHMIQECLDKNISIDTFIINQL